jgi:hypothetical protein
MVGRTGRTLARPSICCMNHALTRRIIPITILLSAREEIITRPDEGPQVRVSPRAKVGKALYPRQNRAFAACRKHWLTRRGQVSWWVVKSLSKEIV